MSKAGEAPRATLDELAKELVNEYQETLRGETNALNNFTQQLQDYVFDYFNIIVKEYLMSLDKWGSDEDYVKQVKEGYGKVDKEIEEDERSYALPEKLDA